MIFNRVKAILLQKVPQMVLEQLDFVLIKKKKFNSYLRPHKRLIWDESYTKISYAIKA